MTDLKAPVTAFLAQLAQRRSASTVENYARDLRRMQQVLLDHQLENWGAADQYVWLEWLNQLSTTTSLASRRRYLSSLRQFYRFLLNEHLVEKDPTRDLKLPPLVATPTPHLSEPAMVQLLTAVKDTTPLALRDRALLELLYATGVKVSELLTLDVTDLNFELGFLTVRDHLGQARLLPLSPVAQHWLQRYLQVARPLLQQDGRSAGVFLNARGRRLSRQAVWQLLKTTGQAAALTIEVTPQVMRESFTAHLLAHQADYLVVMQLLGKQLPQAPLVPFGRVKAVYQATFPRYQEEG